MPARKKPTFLKRQKELQRVARANEKRDARRAREIAKSLGLDDPESDFGSLDDLVGHWHEPVWRYVRRILDAPGAADDVSQEVWADAPVERDR